MEVHTRQPSPASLESLDNLLETKRMLNFQMEKTASQDGAGQAWLKPGA